MKNLIILTVSILLFMSLAHGFGTETEKAIDTIKNNTASNITLSPDNKVINTSFSDGEFILQSGATKEVNQTSIAPTDLILNSLLINTTAPLQGGGDLTTNKTLSILQSNTTQDGYLSTTDWNIFNDKQDALPVGIDGQVLTLSSGVETWVDPAISTTLDTKGQIQGFSTVNASISPCTDDQFLLYDSLEATGWKCADFTLPSTSPTTTQGDLILRGVTEDERLPIGVADTVLSSDGTNVSWQPVPVSLPDQTGNAFKMLVTNGNTANWINVNDQTAAIKGNLLTCPSFEGCIQDFTTTMSAGINTSVIGYRSLEVAAYDTRNYELSVIVADATVNSSFESTENFDGKQMVLYCEMRTANEGVTMSVEVDGVTETYHSLEINSSDKWRQYKIPFVGGASSNKIIIAGDITTTTPIRVDNCYFGRSDNETTIGITEVVVEAYSNDGEVITASTEDMPFKTIGTDTANAWTNAGNTGNNTPDAFIVPETTYYDIDISYLMSIAANPDTMVYVDGVLYAKKTHAASRSVVHVSFLALKFNKGQVVTFRSTVSATLGIDTSYHRIRIAKRTGESATIVQQETELTAKTANEFSFSALDTGVLTNNSYGFIDGNCVISDTSLYTCTLGGVDITEPMSCTATVSTSNRAITYLKSSSIISTISFRTKNAAKTTNLTSAFSVTCSKHNDNLNKSQKIIGSFEQIKSDDLVKVDATGTDTTTYSGTDIPFSTVTVDTKNNWDGTKFTQSKEGRRYYIIQGSIVYTTPATRRVDLYIDGSLKKSCGDTVNYDSHAFGCIFSIDNNQNFSLRAANGTLINSSIYHHLMILDFPDYESAVANIMDSQTEVCETKYLSADVTGVGLIAESVFSGLETGKVYEYCFNVSVYETSTASNSKSMTLRVDGLNLPNVPYPTRDANPVVNFRSTMDNCYKFTSDGSDVGVYAYVVTHTKLSSTNGGDKYFQLCKQPATTILK